MTQIIAITGKMFSGKSEVVRIIDLELATVGKDVSNYKFAQALYDIQTTIYERISRPIPHPKDRKLLQWLGTEWGRSIDENLWVNLWKQEVGWALENIKGHVALNDDCRFDNEAVAVGDMKGVIIRIEASEKVRAERAEKLGIAPGISGHASEAGLSDKYIDYTLVNDGTPEQLRAKVRVVLKQLELI